MIFSPEKKGQIVIKWQISLVWLKKSNYPTYIDKDCLYIYIFMKENHENFIYIAKISNTRINKW